MPVSARHRFFTPALPFRFGQMDELVLPYLPHSKRRNHSITRLLRRWAAKRRERRAVFSKGSILGPLQNRVIFCPTCLTDGNPRPTVVSERRLAKQIGNPGRQLAADERLAGRLSSKKIP